MKKILFVTPSLGFAGAAKMLAFVANQLFLRGNEVHIANLNITTDKVEQSVESGIPIYNLYLGGHGMSKKLSAVKALAGYVRKNKIDVMVGFTMFPNFLDAAVQKITGIPAIMSERGDPNRTFGNDAVTKFIVSVIQGSSGAVFQTEGAGEYYSKRLKNRGVVIPNPIFINEEIPSYIYTPENKTVISLGRLDNTQKRYDVMLKAFAEVVEKHPEYILKIYGSGADEALITALGKELKISRNIKLMGKTDAPLKAFSEGGIFLITSDYEGISNSLLEAMAVGLPCVSTDHTPGGARLLIENGINGLLAPVGDSSGLANAVCEFVEKPELAAKCGKNAKKVVDRFAPDRIVDMWEKYIDEVCSKRR